jgi:hypothetical protein
MKPATLLLVSMLAAQEPDSQALQRMVATERAFAAATAEIGIRDGFLAFFADDAVHLQAGAPGAAATLVEARPALAAQAMQKLPIQTRLMWEPYTGHVSSDGSFGWLTGGFVQLDTVTKDIRGQGAYFSVWKRQSNGTWRVWLDEGVALPDVWQDASPFRVAPEPDAGASGGAAGSAQETIDSVETLVAGGGEPWHARLAANIRLHRQGRMPFVGREAAVGFASEAWASVRFKVLRTEMAASGDLAVAIGSYDATPIARGAPPGTGSERGTWIRVWKRDVAGRWRIVFETSKTAPPR